MPRPLIVFLVFSLWSANLYGQQAKAPSPAVKRILDKAVADVKKNCKEFDEANQKPLGDARVELQDLSTRLIAEGKAEEATAVLRQLGTLEADVMRMVSGDATVGIPTAVRPSLDQAVLQVLLNREDLHQKNAKPLGDAREALIALSGRQAEARKITDAIATLRQVASLERDIIALADGSAPTEPEPSDDKGKVPNPAQRGAISWGGHKYKAVIFPATWKEAKRLCEENGGHLVIIEDEMEQMFIHELLVKSGISVDRTEKDWDGFWIGATDEEK